MATWNGSLIKIHLKHLLHLKTLSLQVFEAPRRSLELHPDIVAVTNVAPCVCRSRTLVGSHRRAKRKVEIKVLDWIHRRRECLSRLPVSAAAAAAAPLLVMTHCIIYRIEHFDFLLLDVCERGFKTALCGEGHPCG